MGLRDWQGGQLRARDMEASGLDASLETTVEHATTAFEADAVNSMKPATLRKYKLLFRQFKAFCEAKKITNLNQLTVPVVRDFRNSWKLSPRTAGKHLERLKRFFNFCMENNWLKTSPATALRVGKITESEVVPFTEEEVEKILKACDERKTAKDALTQSHRLRLLAEFMLATGWRIGDAVMLSTDKIIKDGSGYSLVLRTAKRGSDVTCPIPTPLATSSMAVGPRPVLDGKQHHRRVRFPLAEGVRGCVRGS